VDKNTYFEDARMLANRAWVMRNLGFDPIATPAPAETFAFKGAALPSATPEDLQREVIDFDSEAPAGREFLAFTTATGLSRFEDIPWPKGLDPRTGAKPPGKGSGALPKADALVVTWTVDEGHALSRVLTPGKDSRNDYLSYTHNFAAISKKMRKGCPALEAHQLGAYWTTTIGGKKVVVFKSDSHLSQDVKTLPAGNGTLPNYDLWKQMIQEVQPKLVITTGTAGGIGKQWEVGDVIVSPIVRYDGQNWLKRAQYHDAIYKNTAPGTKYFAQARTLFKANSGQLPKDNTRPPKIVVSSDPKSSVVTTDFFGFDTSDNHYGLRDWGDVSEMGDAVLGQVMSAMGNKPPWVAVRNVSDPQIQAVGTLKDQAALAAHIYKGFGRWSSVCSGIVCWALIAAL
jgi:nucleoside phosphorylase